MGCRRQAFTLAKGWMVMSDLVNPETITLADWDGNLFRLPRVLLEHYRVPELTVRLVRTNGHAGPYPQRPPA